MQSRTRRYAFPRLAITTILLLLGLMAIATTSSAAQMSDAPPGIGSITLDSYDCHTGALDIHVPVTNLPHMANGNGYLSFEVRAWYERGPLDASLPASGYNAPASLAPFTGDVSFHATIRPSIYDAGGEGPSGSIKSLELAARVGSPAGGIVTSNATYTVDCAQANLQTDTLVDQLISQLVLLLQELLNG